MEQVAFGYARGWHFLVVGASLLMTAFGIWLYWIPGATFGLFIAGLGVLSAFGALRRAVDGRPQILLQVDGLVVRAQSMTIPWDFILDVSVGELRVNTRSGEDVRQFLLLKVRDPEVLAARVGPLRLHKRVEGSKVNMLFGPLVALATTTRETVPDLIEVSTRDLDVEAIVVAKAIKGRLEQLRGKGAKVARASPPPAPSAPRIAVPTQGAYRSGDGGTEPVHFPAPSRATDETKE